jgi:arginyl-tRNA synthetase
MSLINIIKKEFLALIKACLGVEQEQLSSVEITLNVDKDRSFGDLSCNVAMILSKLLKENPKILAQKIVAYFEAKKSSSEFVVLKENVKSISIAGPGFLNITFTDQAFVKIAIELFEQEENLFKLDSTEKRFNYLVEFVSANPTGPLHLGHGRGGIIGDVLSNVLNFIGHNVTREFYINDAGKQINKLGQCFKARCLQQLGMDEPLPEDGYAGEYLIDLAKECAKDYGQDLLKKDEAFFIEYAKNEMLKNIQKDLKDYGIRFDNWFSEKTLHQSGAVEQTLKLLKQKDLVYEQDGALWFRSTKFGDDKDRVVKKSDGELTYIAADIAYHKDKFERGFNKLVDVLGQDHHGYVKRLKATVQAMGFDAENLDVILYQLVTVKNKEEVVRMSKRAGTFTTLKEVVETVGKDVARFFYLNRKAEAHLEFDLSVALKKTEENPVFYIQYAYVRTRGILEKASQEEVFAQFVEELYQEEKLSENFSKCLECWSEQEFELLKKLISAGDILNVIAQSYQTHLLAYYVFELAHKFHNYYANNKIVDLENVTLSKSRLFLIFLIRNILQMNFDLLGISKPERM